MVVTSIPLGRLCGESHPSTRPAHTLFGIPGTKLYIATVVRSRALRYGINLGSFLESLDEFLPSACPYPVSLVSPSLLTSRRGLSPLSSRSLPIPL